MKNLQDPKSILENETHKILWNFEIQTDHLISARWQDLVVVNNNKRTCQIVDFTVPVDYGVKLKESEKKDKYCDLARELKKLWNVKVSDTSCNLCAWHSHQRIDNGTGGLGNKRTLNADIDIVKTNR